MSKEKVILAEELIYEASEDTGHGLTKDFVVSLAIKISETFDYNSEVSTFGLMSASSENDEIGKLKKENYRLKDLLNKYKRSATYHQAYVKSIRDGESRRDSSFAGARAIRELERDL